LLLAPGMRLEFLNGVADDDDAVVKAFADHNRESALKTKPKVWNCIICLFLSGYLFFLFLHCLRLFDGIGAVWCWYRRAYPQGLSRGGQAHLGSHDHRPTGLIEFWAVSSHESPGNTSPPMELVVDPEQNPEWQKRHDARHGCGRPRVRGLGQDPCSLALGQAGVS
jgi:hypothetical protein